MKTMNGWEHITKIQTINSMYADNYVSVWGSDGKEYRMSTTTIENMANMFRFDVEMKKKYGYLVEPELVPDTG